ncbi:MAG TPA: hypothetical protein VK837_10180 [Longimicrobiales bacterium]|nr:hypothetical protein [Longimicrobiales bacterium]
MGGAVPTGGAEDLAALPLDVLVRRYPEALACLRGAGLDPAAGIEPLGARGDDGPAGGLLEILAERIAWRRR